MLIVHLHAICNHSIAKLHHKLKNVGFPVTRTERKRSTTIWIPEISNESAGMILNKNKIMTNADYFVTKPYQII